LTQPNEQDALALLNAGAISILCSPADLEQLESVPRERLIHIADDGSPDEAIPKGHVVAMAQPQSDRIAELEMARIDCLVDATKLTPEVIADFFKTVLVTDREDGLWSTLIVDPLGIALGLAYSNYESLLYAIENRCGTYWSRSRDGLWIKGETSGATQQLLGIRLDCDRDCLRFRVTQDPPGFCHRNTHTCFGEQRTIQSVMQRLVERINETDEKSFTRKLANDATMLETKLLEEARELSEASQTDDLDEIAWEAADVLYFSLVAMLKNGVTLDRVYNELARRMNRVVRRKNKLEQPKEEKGNS
jgi:phosphoribosyl-ATP pyrophosphohydrolase